MTFASHIFRHSSKQLRNAPGVLRQDHAVLVRWFSHSNGSVTSRGNVAHHASGDNTCLCKSCIGSASSTPMFTRSYRAVNTTKGQNGLAAKADQTSVSGMVFSRGISCSDVQIRRRFSTNSGTFQVYL
ncbi:hypothetical protein CTI12_AA629130 [Artemisia annua]|uniref:Uncharacterized protein n=1 Tax=Artemisia annua TaxID=35608 RepID=A0A2U1K9E8_ARTAN|nr:hypothetical protein CTI12_AA629130 [Artemisia annua]